MDLYGDYLQKVQGKSASSGSSTDTTKKTSGTASVCRPMPALAALQLACLASHGVGTFAGWAKFQSSSMFKPASLSRSGQAMRKVRDAVQWHRLVPPGFANAVAHPRGIADTPRPA